MARPACSEPRPGPAGAAPQIWGGRHCPASPRGTTSNWLLPGAHPALCRRLTGPTEPTKRSVPVTPQRPHCVLGPQSRWGRLVGSSSEESPPRPGLGRPLAPPPPRPRCTARSAALSELETTALEVSSGLDAACSLQLRASQMSPQEHVWGCTWGQTSSAAGCASWIWVPSHTRGAPGGTATRPQPGAHPQQVWTQTFVAARSEGQWPLMG